MDEIWKTVDEIPVYEVSNLGHVRRIGKTEPLVPTEAKGGALFVTMTYDGERYSRAIKGLVARAFVPKPDNQDPDIFDTPVQCSLSMSNLRADNIVWRPRWFAIAFRRHLHPSYYDQPRFTEVPVLNINTRTQHASILTAALQDCVLMRDIYHSAGEGRPVFPTGHRYEFMWRIENDLMSVHHELV